jgi:hypothetical protein
MGGGGGWNQFQLLQESVVFLLEAFLITAIKWRGEGVGSFRREIIRLTVIVYVQYFKERLFLNLIRNKEEHVPFLDVYLSVKSLLISILI